MVPESIAKKFPEWTELVEREGRHVPEEHRKDFVQMCREMRHLELEQDGRQVRNMGNFVTINLVFGKKDVTAVNHAVRVTERALWRKIPIPPAGDWPQ